MANEAYDALRQMANSRAAASGFQAFGEALSRGRALAQRERALEAREREALSAKDALASAMAEMGMSGGPSTGRTKGSSSAALGGMGFGRGEDVRAAYNEQVAMGQQLAQEEAALVAEQNRREIEAENRRIAAANQAANQAALLRQARGAPGVGGAAPTPSPELVASRDLASALSPALDLDTAPVGPAFGTSKEAMAERLGISGASDESIRSAIGMILAERALAAEQPPEGEIASISPAYRAQLGLAAAQGPDAASVEMSPSYAREVAQREMGIATPSPAGLAGALMTGPGDAELVRANLASLNEGSLDLAIKSLMGESEPVAKEAPTGIGSGAALSEADIAAMEGGAPPPPSQGYRVGARPTMLEAAFDQAAKPQVSVPGAAAPASEAATGPVAHSVQKGDTLFELAKANDTTVEAIVKANPGIKDPNLIEVGQSITMPRGGAPRVDETVAMVSAGEPAPAPPKGSAAEAISRKDDITLMSDAAIKGRLLALSEEKGGIKGNPLAEASGGSMDPSVIPRIAEVENAIIDAKKGDKRHLSRILGKSLNWQDVRKMDLNKLSADYRSWAGGLNIRADEIKADRRLEAEIKQTKAYEGKAAMFEVAFRGIYPDATPEEVEVFNNAADSIYKAGNGDKAVMDYLNMFRNLEKDQQAKLLADRKAEQAAIAAKMKGSIKGGSKSAMKNYFEYLGEANVNEKMANSVDDKILEIQGNPLFDDAKKASLIAAQRQSKSDFEGLANYYRSEAEKLRAANQGLDYATSVSIRSGFLSQFEKAGRARIDAAPDKEAEWKRVMGNVKNRLATQYDIYPGINEDVEAIELILRSAYAKKPATEKKKEVVSEESPKVTQTPADAQAEKDAAAAKAYEEASPEEDVMLTRKERAAAKAAKKRTGERERSAQRGEKYINNLASVKRQVAEFEKKIRAEAAKGLTGYRKNQASTALQIEGGKISRQLSKLRLMKGQGVSGVSKGDLSIAGIEERLEDLLASSRELPYVR